MFCNPRQCYLTPPEFFLAGYFVDLPASQIQTSWALTGIPEKLNLSPMGMGLPTTAARLIAPTVPGNFIHDGYLVHIPRVFSTVREGSPAAMNPPSPVACRLVFRPAGLTQMHRQRWC